MSNYVFGTSLSYVDYLQAANFEDSYRSTISEHTRSIIASNEELQREHISICETLSETVSSGFEQLSYDLQAIAEGVSELNATFQWGFSKLLESVGQTNTALFQLVKIAKTPAQTWAYEQFEIARDAYRQDLHDDALEYLDRAINGHAGNTGYKLEYRFHYLLGTIRLGSFTNNSQDIVNLIDAENAFLNAAKYAHHYYPKEAAHAFLAAGWAAYCQGKMPEAERYTEQALSLCPDLQEGRFQIAKIQMHVGDVDRAITSLRRVIELDRGYSIKAASDDDFMCYEAKVYALLDTLRQETKEKAEAALAAIKQDAVETERQHINEFSLPKYADLTSAEHALHEASDAARNDTYFGYLDALSLCAEVKVKLEDACSRFQRGVHSELNQRIAALNARISNIGKASMGKNWKTIRMVGIAIFTILGVVQALRVEQANVQQFQIRKQAAARVFAELRRKGYDPAKLSLEEGRRLGYRVEDMPPASTGDPRVWLGSFFWGGILFWFGFAAIGKKVQKIRTTATLKGEKDRLQSILNNSF